jgi:SAM-dependent methyltransferase
LLSLTGPADDRRVDETWMLDELLHAGPEHLDAEFITGFDRKQGYPDPGTDIAAFAAHGLDRMSAVVDFGAGTGQFAIPAAQRFGRVTAVDVSPAMLTALRARARATATAPAAAAATDAATTRGAAPVTETVTATEAVTTREAAAATETVTATEAATTRGAAPVTGAVRAPATVTAPEAADDGWPGLECVRGGFLSYSPAGPVDGVYTRNTLHQLPDFWKAIALRRIADMLRPGGVLRLRDLVYDFQPDEAETVFAGWFAAAATDPAAGYTAADYAEHIRTEHSTFRWLLEPMLAAAGLEVTDVSYERRLYGTYTCVKPVR